ncbi:MAG: hypothetical protein L0K86_29395 [Actinomycetia bacterium]|nr:hypothetical protein [Actinomycetes bacterium]
MSLFTRRSARWADHEYRAEIAAVFRAACIGAGVAQLVDGPVAGTTHRAPEVTHIGLGGPSLRLTVRMLPGQEPAQLARVGRLIAPHLGGLALRVTDRGHGWALVDVLTADPLAGVVPLVLPRPDRRVLIGRTENGAALAQDWRAGAHTICQGVTRSGKSVWTYGLLAQLADHPDVLIAGCDPTGLLWRPFADSRHARWQVCGVGDPARHQHLLTRLCTEMDQRIAALPVDADTLTVTRATPLLLVVLEEYPALLRVVDSADKDLGKSIRAQVGRLLAEGAKVGVRVVILAQRAEAAVIGAFERAMCSWRLSFRTDNRASVELLHPGADPGVADAHTTAEPGIALVTMPGRPLTRVRDPYLGGYREYVAAVGAALERADPAGEGGSAA